jgi:hypothetical protein
MFPHLGLIATIALQPHSVSQDFTYIIAIVITVLPLIAFGRLALHLLQHFLALTTHIIAAINV